MRILHIVINPFTSDSRVLKSARTAQSIADAVCVFAMHDRGLPESEDIGDIKVSRFPLKTRSWSKLIVVQFIKYFELFFRMRRKGIKWKPSIVHAHDLNALPIGRAIAKRTGARLIYDSHELWIGRQNHDSYIWPVRVLMDTAELLLARKCDEVIAVSSGIAKILEKRLHRNTVHVVRNVPDRWTKPQAHQLRLRSTLGIPRDKRVILYQGNMVADGRVECLLEAYTRIQNRQAALVFMGSGPMAVMLQAEASNPTYHGSLYYLPAVPPAELPYYTSDADIGVVPIPDVCLSYKLALPNKFFEFIQGRLSIIASNLPEMSQIVEEYGVGLTYEAGNATKLADGIDALLQDTDLFTVCRKNADHAAEVLNWQNEERILLNIYSLGSP